MKLHEFVADAFNEWAAFKRESLEATIDFTLAGIEKCQSPMEQRLLVYLLSLMHAEPVVTPAYPDFEEFIIEDEERDGFLTLRPQAPVKIEDKQFFADFLFTYSTRRPMAEHFRLVIEVDGHAYHERTKEQARRDRLRDRLMLMEGYMVLRYTGSEIYQDVGGVAFELHYFLHQQMRKAAAKVGIE